jgi:hypothetical protein
MTGIYHSPAFLRSWIEFQMCNHSCLPHPSRLNFICVPAYAFIFTENTTSVLWGDTFTVVLWLMYVGTNVSKEHIVLIFASARIWGQHIAPKSCYSPTRQYDCYRPNNNSFIYNTLKRPKVSSYWINKLGQLSNATALIASKYLKIQFPADRKYITSLLQNKIINAFMEIIAV